MKDNTIGNVSIKAMEENKRIHALKHNIRIGKFSEWNIRIISPA
jgi:hypothetical protein